MSDSAQFDGNQMVLQIQAWARELGFSQIGVASVDLSTAEQGLRAWLAQGFHGEMHYMERHGMRRARPAELVPGTVSVLTARMDYLGRATSQHWQAQELARQHAPQQGLVSVYARGRDYHKVMRRGLQALAQRIAQAVAPVGYRVFTDSAPVLEVELAQRSGLGWRGKHTLLLDRQAGSMFFLGEIFLDLALPETPRLPAHCGSCSACMVACPTQAIVAPYRLDARRCISYLTIEHEGSIAPSLRAAIGNRIYGCDDCQLVCPWNRYAQRSRLADFDPREGPDGELLTTLLGWSEVEFQQRTEGTPVRRIGHIRWLRNISVAIGNALRENPSEAAAAAMLQALRRVSTHSSEIVREHALWAMEQWSGASRP